MISSDTPAQLQSDECICVVPPFRTKILSMAFKQWRSSAMEICLNKDLVVVLSSLHMNRNKLKGNKDFSGNNTDNWPCVNVICVILQAHAILADFRLVI